MGGLALPPASAAISTRSLALPPTPAATPRIQSPDIDFDGDLCDSPCASPGKTHQAFSDAELDASISTPALNARLYYGPHSVDGTLYLLPTKFSELYLRFMDIFPCDLPKLTDAEPWVLFHEIHGMTWIDRSWFEVAGLNIKQENHRQIRFLAFTDNERLFKLGEPAIPTCESLLISS